MHGVRLPGHYEVVDAELVGILMAVHAVSQREDAHERNGEAERDHELVPVVQHLHELPLIRRPPTRSHEWSSGP